LSRGWNPEQGLHLAQELIGDIVRVAAASEGSLIRLRRFQTYEQEVELIRARETQKPNYTVDPDARKSGARGSP
jgi:LPS sulfotransferase NodH